MTPAPAELGARLEGALDVALAAVAPFLGGRVGAVGDKGGGDPVTAADRALDDALRGFLPRAGEGWLSEETVDDRSRLTRSRVWIVDPLDGTREFVAGIPEWAVSIGLVEDGRPLAGAVLNPATGERFVGVVGQGLWRNGQPARVNDRAELAGTTVLASRSELARGDWARLAQDSFTVVPTGSIAYKMARVAAGCADATWSLRPKNEWDVAAGVALVHAGGGAVVHRDGGALRFNQVHPLMPGPIAAGARLIAPIRQLLGA